jgi:hypothetical protein
MQLHARLRTAQEISRVQGAFQIVAIVLQAHRAPPAGR